MIVPRYWAEGRVRHRDATRQITVRRFGWSDTSAEDAQRNADQRALASLERILAGARVARREPKVPYNGAEGVPIREEIVDRQGETIITRNAYGARCLNTPNVLFVDIDFELRTSARIWLPLFLFFLIGGVAAAWSYLSVPLGFALLFGAALLATLTATSCRLLIQRAQGGAEAIARRRVERFAQRRPHWSLRVYRTPAGFRLLATHQPFEPRDAEVAECFRALDADPLYARMCHHQNCFRARISPKPWRMSIEARLRPRPGVWPVTPERLPLRVAWIAQYETAARNYAACRYLETFGNGVVHPAVRAVQEWHDELSGAHQSLPLA